MNGAMTSSTRSTAARCERRYSHSQNILLRLIFIWTTVAVAISLGLPSTGTGISSNTYTTVADAVIFVEGKSNAATSTTRKPFHLYSSHRRNSFLPVLAHRHAKKFWNDPTVFATDSNYIRPDSNTNASHGDVAISQPQHNDNEDLAAVVRHTTGSTALRTIGMICRGGGATNPQYDGRFFAATDGLHLPSKNIIYEAVLITMQIITTTFRAILPPIVITVRTVVDIYKVLPMDVLWAQIGFVYAFAGGYYPTLFAAIQAAQHCGYYDMITAIKILYNEASTAIQACNFPSIKFSPKTMEFNQQKARDLFIEKTKIVMATIDPVRINQAIAAIYTTWFSISIVLEREFARTITLSITIAESIQPIVSFLLVKPLQLCIADDYYQWIPILIGWVCKALAMSLAWRIQRVLTAYTSAIAGGLMCSRALFRILHKQSGNIRRFFGLSKNKKQQTKTTNNDPNMDDSHMDEFLGYIIAMCGLYAQIGDGKFSFEVPFPLNLVSWPFDLAERWIQWQITKKSGESTIK